MSDLLDLRSADSHVVIHEGGATVFGPVGLPISPGVRMGAHIAVAAATPIAAASIAASLETEPSSITSGGSRSYRARRPGGIVRTGS
jgi:hypothetical protein